MVNFVLHKFYLNKNIFYRRDRDRDLDIEIETDRQSHKEMGR